jgi:hypothetical protein
MVGNSSLYEVSGDRNGGKVPAEYLATWIATHREANLVRVGRKRWSSGITLKNPTLQG